MRSDSACAGASRAAALERRLTAGEAGGGRVRCRGGGGVWGERIGRNRRSDAVELRARAGLATAEFSRSRRGRSALRDWKSVSSRGSLAAAARITCGGAQAAYEAVFSAAIGEVTARPNRRDGNRFFGAEVGRRALVEEA